MPTSVQEELAAADKQRRLENRRDRKRRLAAAFDVGRGRMSIAGAQAAHFPQETGVDPSAITPQDISIYKMLTAPALAERVAKAETTKDLLTSNETVLKALLELEGKRITEAGDIAKQQNTDRLKAQLDAHGKAYDIINEGFEVVDLNETQNKALDALIVAIQRPGGVIQGEVNALVETMRGEKKASGKMLSALVTIRDSLDSPSIDHVADNISAMLGTDSDSATWMHSAIEDDLARVVPPQERARRAAQYRTDTENLLQNAETLGVGMDPKARDLMRTLIQQRKDVVIDPNKKLTEEQRQEAMRVRQEAEDAYDGGTTVNSQEEGFAFLQKIAASDNPERDPNYRYMLERLAASPSIVNLLKKMNIPRSGWNEALLGIVKAGGKRDKILTNLAKVRSKIFMKGTQGAGGQRRATRDSRLARKSNRLADSFDVEFEEGEAVDPPGGGASSYRGPKGGPSPAATPKSEAKSGETSKTESTQLVERSAKRKLLDGASDALGAVGQLFADAGPPVEQESAVQRDTARRKKIQENRKRLLRGDFGGDSARA